MYTIKVRTSDMTLPGAFVAVMRLDPEAIIELEGADGEREVYSIQTAYDIDRLLDLEEAVIEYAS